MTHSKDSAAGIPAGPHSLGLLSPGSPRPTEGRAGLTLGQAEGLAPGSPTRPLSASIPTPQGSVKPLAHSSLDFLSLPEASQPSRPCTSLPKPRAPAPPFLSLAPLHPPSRTSRPCSAPSRASRPCSPPSDPPAPAPPLPEPRALAPPFPSLEPLHPPFRALSPCMLPPCCRHLSTTQLPPPILARPTDRAHAHQAQTSTVCKRLQGQLS